MIGRGTPYPDGQQPRRAPRRVDARLRMRSKPVPAQGSGKCAGQMARGSRPLWPSRSSTGQASLIPAQLLYGSSELNLSLARSFHSELADGAATRAATEHGARRCGRPTQRDRGPEATLRALRVVRVGGWLTISLKNASSVSPWLSQSRLIGMFGIPPEVGEFRQGRR